MTTTVPVPPRSRSNGHGKEPVVRVVGARSRRVPWIALGVVLVIAGALTFGLVVQSAGDRTAVLVAARDIEPGQVIAAGDLRVVDAAIDGTAAMLPAVRRGVLVGQTAATHIPAGSLLNDGQFTTGGRIAAGEVVLGALLGPGALPVADLRAGDRVTLLEAQDSAQPSFEEPEPLGEATVYRIAAGSQPGTQFVSLVIDDAIAQRVTDAAAAQRLHLVLQPGSGA
jgi:hypothetical protein